LEEKIPLSRKKTAVLFFIFILISGFYYLKVGKFSSGFFSQAPEAARSRILPLDSEETIERMTLKDHEEDTEISLRQISNHEWRIEKPVHYPAESLVVDGLASLLRLTPRSRQLSMEKAGTAELGFESPRLEICVSTNRRKERCLEIGSEAAIVKGGYAKWEDESKYFLVNRNFLDAFDKTLYSLRKKQIFDLLDKEINEIQFRSQNKERFLKRQGKNWVLYKPKEMGLASDSIDNLMVLLNGLYVKGFLDGQDQSTLGLESSREAVRIIFKDGSKQTLTWGSEALGLDAYYALDSEDKTVLLISRGKINEMIEKFDHLA
jgi:hypothetical protein